MTLTTFEITFDNKSKIFCPGQLVKGKVIVVLDNEMETQGDSLLKIIDSLLKN